MAHVQKITPFLWFDDQAEDAARFYVSVFENSKITGVSRYGEAGPRPAGMAMTVGFQLEGQDFTALNGGPEFTFTEAVSFAVMCRNQEEVDHFWEKLTSDGGEEGVCGWLKDKYGLSWQIVPSEMMELLSSPDPARSQQAMRAMMQMKKLNIAELKAAYDKD